MIEKQLENLRKEYQRITPPQYLLDHGLTNLQNRLDEKQASNLRPVFGRGLVFASAILLLAGSVVGVAQAAKPGDALYQVKLAADDAFAKISGKTEIKIGRRGQEIIDVSSESQQQLDEATREYQKSLENSRQDAQKSGRSQNFTNTLDEQERKFREAQEDNPESADKLEEAIKQTEKARGEVQGEKTENSQENNPSNHSDQDHERDDHSD